MKTLIKPIFFASLGMMLGAVLTFAYTVPEPTKPTVYLTDTQKVGALLTEIFSYADRDLLALKIFKIARDEYETCNWHVCTEETVNEPSLNNVPGNEYKYRSCANPIKEKITASNEHEFRICARPDTETIKEYTPDEAAKNEE